MKVLYKVTTNKPYHIENISYNIPNTDIEKIIMKDTASLLLKPGILFARNVLEEERQRISNLLRNNGYYAFNKEYITYTADTSLRNNGVELELNLMPIPVENKNNELIYRKHDIYLINDVYFVTNYNPMSLEQDKRFNVKDTVEYKGYDILYGDKQYLKKEVLINNYFLNFSIK